VDYFDLTSKPIRRCIAEQVPEPIRRQSQPRDPCPSIVSVHLGRYPNPSLTAVGAREIQPRAADVAHDVTDTPTRFALNDGRAPRNCVRWQCRNVSLSSPTNAVEPAQIRRDVGDHVRSPCSAGLNDIRNGGAATVARPPRSASNAFVIRLADPPAAAARAGS